MRLKNRFLTSSTRAVELTEQRVDHYFNRLVQIVGCRGEIEINPRLLMGPETQIRGVGLTAFWDLKVAFNNRYEISYFRFARFLRVMDIQINFNELKY